MKTYRDVDGDSGVEAYEIGEGWIKVKFDKGDIYLYDNYKPGMYHVLEMQHLAEAGNGLNAYINKYVRKNYSEKIE